MTAPDPLSPEERDAVAHVLRQDAGWQDYNATNRAAVLCARALDRLVSECRRLAADNASLRAQLAAASDRYARAVADAEEVRGRLVAERAAALSVTTREGLSASEWVLRTGLAERERDSALAEVARLTRERDEKSAHVDKLQSKLARALAATNGGA